MSRPVPTANPAQSKALTVRAVWEFLGTGALVAIVIGSGIMATRLTGDIGVQLLMNAAATVVGLAVLISTIGPVSGAHFNPVVSLMQWRRGDLALRDLVPYIFSQVAGAVAGAITANLMFGELWLTWSTKQRTGFDQYLGELIATVGLLAVIAASQRFSLNAAALVPMWIGAAYFFTSSTSFANPAVTIGRMFSDSFAGIAPASVLGFVASQVLAAIIVMALMRTRHHTPQE